VVKVEDQIVDKNEKNDQIVDKKEDKVEESK